MSIFASGVGERVGVWGVGGGRGSSVFSMMPLCSRVSKLRGFYLTRIVWCLLPKSH